MDKLGHLVFYGAAMYCFGQFLTVKNSSHLFQKIIWIALALFLLGILLEYLQYILAQGRVMDWFDQLANTMGLGLCYCIFIFRNSILYTNIFRDLEWNELIFKNRNKKYGAYELRQKYGRTISFSFIASILIFLLIIIGPQLMKYIFNLHPNENAELYEVHDVNLSEPPAGNQGKEKTVPVLKNNQKADQKPAAKESSKEITNPKVTKEEIVVDKKIKEDSQTSDQGSLNNSQETQQGTQNGSNTSEGDSTQSNMVWKKVTQAPVFAGCEEIGINYKEKKKCSDSKLLSFLKSNIKYPKRALENKTEGTVLIQFIVEKNGSISNIKLLKDIGDGCGSEAVRALELINSMKLYWQPGIQGNHAVRFQYTLPVEFEVSW